MQTRSFDVVLALVSGALLALSFPNAGHPACAWIALAPLLVALRHGSLRRAFALGASAGMVYFGGTLYWITNVMAVYGDLQRWVAILVNLLLIATLALFPAFFALIVRHLMTKLGVRALIAVPFVWVATELARAYPLGGFPWVLLGYSQVEVTPIAQVASLVGVYGLGALVASVSAATAAAALVAAENRMRTGLMVLVPTIGVVLVLAAWGSHRVATAELTRSGQPIRVGLLQGNVDQGEKWDAARATSIFNRYIAMTRQAIARGAQVVIWPESSTPFRFGDDRQGTEQIRTLARQAQVPILLGSEERLAPSAAPGVTATPETYYNAAFMVQADGSTGGVYRKMHLVPFGEYIPLKQLFFFAGPLVERVGGFSAGESPTLLPLNGHQVSTSICYEIVYPNLVHRFVRNGSELLTTITNDAWFGQTSAPYQHFEQASMRAIENGRYLVRAANTGISGIVDPYGRATVASGIYLPDVIVGEARFLQGTTLYARTGDLFAYLSAAVTLVLLLQSRIWRLSTT